MNLATTNLQFNNVKFLAQEFLFNRGKRDLRDIAQIRQNVIDEISNHILEEKEFNIHEAEVMFRNLVRNQTNITKNKIKYSISFCTTGV